MPAAGRWTRLVRAALDGVLRHRTRSALAALGLVVGVAAVVSMVAVAQGTKNRVLDQMTSLGSNQLWLQPAKRRPGGARQASGESRGQLLPGDAAALARLDGVRRVVPLTSRLVRVSGPEGESDTLVYGADPEVFEMQDHGLAQGRYYTSREAKAGKRVAVVGKSLRENIAGPADLVGRTVMIKGQPYLVVGELVPKGVDASGLDNDDRAYVPLKTAQQRVMGDRRRLTAIVLEAESKEALAELPPEVGRMMRQEHRLRRGQPDDFRLESQLDLIAAREDSSRVFGALISGVAGVSLLVAGVGIMAVMLIGMRERTGEIGLRRALGARRRDVRLQFLLEAAVLGLGGGLGGALLGLGLAGALLASGQYRFALPWPAALLGAGVSLGTAIIFGWLPARRAAALPPAEALRED